MRISAAPSTAEEPFTGNHAARSEEEVHGDAEGTCVRAPATCFCAGAGLTLTDRLFVYFLLLFFGVFFTKKIFSVFVFFTELLFRIYCETLSPRVTHIRS